MPNNENNYRIRSEFVTFLKDLPGFKITHSESADFFNVTIPPSYDSNSSYFFRCCSRWPRYNQHYVIKRLFKELEKDHAYRDELNCIGKIFREYFLLLKKVDIQRAYYALTPGIIAGLFIVLHLSLLLFPPSRVLVYSSLMVDLYGLGFWLFSVWSFGQHAKILDDLENKLSKKIDFFQSLSSPIRQTTNHYSEFSESPPPPYEAVLEMGSTDSSTTPVMTSVNVSNFFHSTVLNVDCNCNDTSTNTRQARGYSI